MALFLSLPYGTASNRIEVESEVGKYMTQSLVCSVFSHDDIDDGRLTGLKAPRVTPRTLEIAHLRSASSGSHLIDLTVELTGLVNALDILEHTDSIGLM